MKVTIELDTALDRDSELLSRFVGVVGGELAVATEPAKPRAKKATTPVAGNPDAPAEQAAVTSADPKPLEAPGMSPITVRADAPAEIVALAQQPVDKIDKDVLGKAVLKACKPIAEGGVTRPVVLDILERYRPANLPKPELVKMGAVPPAKYPELRGLILAQYKAA